MVLVASFAEAWIEINLWQRFLFQIGVASFAEAWIEIENSLCDRMDRCCRLLRGGVD